ncbi:hypothetical protein A8B78_22255 [Jannaschia sp. EhC01]|nr:hypothetical protein A8B78_22255 [Jannaschia sp. EhC01]
MTRTGLSARLSAHLAEPFLEIHPKDAARLGLGVADLARVESPSGRAILRVRITDAVAPGQVFAPMHWTGETAPTGRIDAVVAAATDPVSGQPESKASVVSITRFEARWYGFAIAAQAMELDSDYWALARTGTGFRAEFAGCAEVADWEARARAIFGLPEASAASLIDTANGTARIALSDGGRLLGALFIAPSPVAVIRDYLVTLPGSDSTAVLMGRTPADVPDPGPVLCSCFGIGMNTIATGIETGGLMSVEAVGAALQAGTNCGSCRAEIADLLAALPAREAAE